MLFSPHIKSWLPFLDSNKIQSVYDYKFERTPDHLTDEELDKYRWSYDESASKVVETLDEIKRTRPEMETTLPSGLYEKLHIEATSGKDKLISTFWHKIHELPEWVDWESIARGQDVMYRYIGPAWFALNFSSLLGGMGSERIVETLSRTGGFSANVAKKRIFETSQFVNQCMESIECLEPGGSGHIACVRVRLLHATIRNKILSLTENNPSYYDKKSFGIPINDQDSIGTILAFSANLIWIAFPLQGIFLSQQETEDYNALWRLIGHYMGVPTHPFVTAKRAKIWMESIIGAEIKPSPKSKVLANNIITALADQPPFHVSADYLRAQTYWLNGPQLATALGIPKPSILSIVLTSCRILYVALTSWVTKSIPVLDRRNIKKGRTLFYESVLKPEDGMNGRMSKFPFQYIPREGKTTTLGVAAIESSFHKKSLERSIINGILFAVVVAVGVISQVQDLIRWHP